MKLKIGDYLKYTYESTKRGICIYRVIQHISDGRYKIQVILDLDTEAARYTANHSHISDIDCEVIGHFSKMSKDDVIMELL